MNRELWVFDGDDVTYWPNGMYAVRLIELSDEAYLYFRQSFDLSASDFTPIHWYRRDLTPVRDEHVPKKYRTLQLLL